ncbi:unnamed protein product [Blepharisma stoltei]|uniref:Uncharacterized protein n=1 Tax=Blepharisma stoltei TaxID=1481888 RepID=A0AAU9J2Z3_9CILI|nr:unnamed protein product [Blepharisma stoltei]
MGSLREFQAFADKNDIPVKLKRTRDFSSLKIAKQQVEKYLIAVKLIFTNEYLTQVLVKEYWIFKQIGVQIVELNDIIKSKANNLFEAVGAGLFMHKYLETTSMSERTPEKIFIKIGIIVGDFISTANILEEELKKPSRMKKAQEPSPMKFSREQRSTPQNSTRIETRGAASTGFSGQQMPAQQNFDKIDREPYSQATPIKPSQEKMPPPPSDEILGINEEYEVLEITKETFRNYFNVEPPSLFFENTAIIQSLERGLYLIEFYFFYNWNQSSQLETGKFIKIKKNIIAKDQNILKRELEMAQKDFFIQIQAEMREFAKNSPKEVPVMGGEYLQADVDHFAYEME